ncbi:MAG: RNA polymerase sigma factor [Nannocystaceae bacterium]
MRHASALPSGDLFYFAMNRPRRPSRDLSSVPVRVSEAEETALPPGDDELVEGARRGDVEAWSMLYRAHFSRLYRHVGYLVGDVATAEDLSQEIFARALASLPRFDGRSTFSTWLFGIANHAVYKHWRAKARKKRAYDRYELTPPPQGVDPEAAHLTKQRAAALKVVLDGLPDHLREAFVLLDLQELSPAEAAERVGISKGNIAVRASRARARIRKELAAAGWILPRREVSS